MKTLSMQQFKRNLDVLAEKAGESYCTVKCEIGSNDEVEFLGYISPFTIETGETPTSVINKFERKIDDHIKKYGKRSPEQKIVV